VVDRSSDALAGALALLFDTNSAYGSHAVTITKIAARADC
jgi:hypothetical protein